MALWPYYCRPADLVDSLAGTPTHNGTLSTDPAYGLASLADNNPAKMTKWTTLTALRLVYHYVAAPQHLDVVFLANHNADVGSVIRLQANTVDDWGAPPLNRTLTVPALDLDGHRRPLWWNLSGLAVHTYAYWSLLFPANSVAFQIGELRHGALLRSFTDGFFTELRRIPRRFFIPALQTAMGSKNYYDLNVKLQSWLGRFIASDVDLAALEALRDACHGPVYPFYLIPDLTVGSVDGIAHQDGAHLVRFSEESARALAIDLLATDANSLPALELEQVPHGLPL